MPWNPFSKKDKGDDFEALVRDACSQLGIRLVGFEGDRARIKVDGKPHTLYLTNLRRKVAMAPAADRPAVAAQFLRGMTTASSDEGHSLEDVRDRLMPHVGLPFAPGIEEVPPYQVLIPGRPEETRTAKDPAQGTLVIPALPPLQINIVVDEAETVWYIRQKHLDEWKTTLGELLPVALENLRKRSPPSLLRPVEKLPGILACETGDSYDAARMLILKDVVSPWPKEGVVAAVPVRDLLLCVRLDSIDALRAMNPMFAFAQHVASSGAYDITGHALWFDGTTWEYVPTSVSEKKVSVYAPDRFVEMLNRLGGSK